MGVTESSLARLIGCFGPAVRAFFAAHAEQIEAHNLQHHLLPGLNAARGKRGEQIEKEVHWREMEPVGQPPQDADQSAGSQDEAQETLEAD